MKIKSVGQQVPELHPTPETGPLQTSAPEFSVPGEAAQQQSRLPFLDSSVSLAECALASAVRCSVPIHRQSVGCQPKDLSFQRFGCWDPSQLQQAGWRVGRWIKTMHVAFEARWSQVWDAIAALDIYVRRRVAARSPRPSTRGLRVTTDVLAALQNYTVPPSLHPARRRETRVSAGASMFDRGVMSDTVT